MLIRVTTTSGNRMLIDAAEIADARPADEENVTLIRGFGNDGEWTLKVQESIDQIYREQFGPQTTPSP